MDVPHKTVAKAAETNVSAGPVFNQANQQVSQQFNPAGPTTIHLNPPPSVQRPTTRAEIIQAIEREFGQDLRLLERCYVIPDLQDFNPPDEMNSPSLIVSRQPAFQLIDAFTARPSLTESGQRCLFVLGDAGMGKTSLLLMLASRHFAPRKTKTQDCVLIKLGPDTLERIAAVLNPARTVLLLDSLDEDPAAHDHAEGAQGRLLELLPRLVGFHRIILTCRSQFFPENSPHLTTLQGHFVVGPYECPLKYLSLFNDTQVEEYLAKHYRPGGMLQRIGRTLLGEIDIKLAEAREAAKAMESLRLRPLLLSRIDDFVSQDGRACFDFRNSFTLYHRLVDQWLMRDAPKHQGMSTQEGWRAAVLLALHLTRQGSRKISSRALAKIDGLQEIPRFKLEARSLLNRNKDREFQFAHNTIQEFLLAHAILDGAAGFDVTGLPLSRETFRFLLDGTRFLKRETVDLRGARTDFPEAAIELVRLAFGIELVAIAPGEFLMGSPTNECGREGDETQHQVRLTQPFWIGRYPVTQAEYEAVMGDNPSNIRGPRRPVEQVDWLEATAFCTRLTECARTAGCLPEDFTFRLPTEAEWEYACRAGTRAAFNDGSGCTKPVGRDPALQRLGWFGGNSDKQTHPVGEKSPNAWGLYDMHGNVWEWCLDGLREYSADLQTDPLGLESRDASRASRGGAWGSLAWGCRAACRAGLEPGYRGGGLGLRLAAGQEPGRGAPSLPAGGAAAPGSEDFAGKEEKD